MSKMAKKSFLIAGARTPFVKSFGQFMKVDQIGLGVGAVQGLITKQNLDPKDIDEIVWGNVVYQTAAPNVGREIVIDLNLPKDIVGHTVSMACASGLKAVCDADMIVEGGHANCVIAGGSDSMSCAEVPLPRKFMHGLAQFKYGPKHPAKQVKAFLKNAGPPPGWLPSLPAIAERSTGKTMGYHADLIAELQHVARSEQEKFAIRSHQNALEAQKKGYFDQEIGAFDIGGGKAPITEDNMIRDQDPIKIAKMRTAFRKGSGASITAATSSGLTDGGSCIMVANGDFAKAHGYPTDIQLKAWVHAAIDPFPSLLLAPALAIPKALKKAGLKLSDIDVFEIHEAFAAQVLATAHVLNDERFCKDWLDCGPIGSIDMSKVNLNGGSLAIGHPFAATGGRVVMSAMNELRRSGKKHALVSICAAGGLGSVAILERV